MILTMSMENLESCAIPYTMLLFLSLEIRGYPTIPDPDPAKPDEAESWLSLEITVNPWTWYRQEEEL